MRHQFSIARHLLAAWALLAILVAAPVRAADVVLAPDAPSRYVVKKGDTLWSISGKFLKDPWRWPDIWRMNRSEIKNPHWIYPGDVVVMEMVDGQPRLALERDGKVVSPLAQHSPPVRVASATRSAASSPAAAAAMRDTVNVSPRIRITPLDVDVVPSIPAGDLQPFLSRPLITGPDGLYNAAEIVAGRDQRVVRGQGDVVYAAGVDRTAGDAWYIYRPGRVFARYDNPADILGYEQRYIASAKVERFGDISSVRIGSSNEEVEIGDRLVPQPRGQLINYAPHAPDRDIGGYVIAMNQEASEAGVGWIVTIDKGALDGVDIGTVLAIYKVFPPLPDPRPSKEVYRSDTNADQTRFYQPTAMLDLPDERSGLLFVFRVFDRVSYALLVRTTEPIEVGNYVRKP